MIAITDEADRGMLSSPAMSPRKLLIARLVLVSTTFGFGIVAAEIATRLVAPQALLHVTPGLYLPDAPRRYKLASGYTGTLENVSEFSTQLRVNSRGVRGPELDLSAEDSRQRLLIIGDSFTFGHGVELEQAFTYRAATMLTDAGEPTIGINGGVPGFGIPDEVAWLEAHGLGFEPDIIVLAVFLGNDLQDARKETTELVDGLEAAVQSGGLTDWLNRHSHLFRLTRSSIAGSVERRLRELFGRKPSYSHLMLVEEFEVYSKQWPEEMERARERTAAALERLVEAAGDRRVAALLIPSNLTLDDNRFKETLNQLELDPESVDSGRPRREVTRLLEEREIPTLDLTEPFATALQNGTALYFVHDRHWTVAGHELAGQLLADFLTAEVSR